MQTLARRVERGGALAFSGVAAPAQPFLAALLRNFFPRRTIVVVTENLKAQESFQQDLETWLAEMRSAEMRSAECGMRNETGVPSSILDPPSSPLFYPAWEILPHEGKLPHADVISERLQTLVALRESQISNFKSQIIVASVTALLQKTFAPDDLKERLRPLRRGDKIAPLDLIEFLEEQGYEPEAQVSQKGELALRGGIVVLFPPSSPWPVRLEFFGDELESLRFFDPGTQISREEISEVIIPPAGEIGILKQSEGRVPRVPDQELGTRGDRPSENKALATLLDHLPCETIFLLCEPDSLAIHADSYSQQIPQDDPFFIAWLDFLAELNRRGFTSVELNDTETIGAPVSDPARFNVWNAQNAGPEAGAPHFSSLDAFRPLAERAPEPQIAEVQRREFFQQLHRWLRQDYAVHVFCNNDGERERFLEIWMELVGQASSLPAKREGGFVSQGIGRLEARPTIHLGSLARGFLCDEAKLVVVTDAEIFGRYKIQRPRKLKSAHAVAARSALDIDFTDLEEGDLVVHLQHGIGRYLGLKNLPAMPDELDRLEACSTNSPQISSKRCRSPSLLQKTWTA